MAKGHYKKEYGGSKSGYEKGIKDTLLIIGVLAIITVIIYLTVK